MNIEWGDLEIFLQTRTKAVGPLITISNNKIITLSVGFLRHAKSQVADNTYVILSFSRTKNAIVFKFIPDDNSPGAIKMSIRDKNVNSGANLAAKSFFAFYEIEVEKYVGRYTAKLEEIPGRGPSWVVYLNEGLKKNESCMQNSALQEMASAL